MPTAEPGQAAWSRPWREVASDELSAALETIGSSRHCADGQIIYQRGDPGAELYGVKSGLVRAAAFTPNGYEGLLGLYPAGTWFGEVSLFDDLPRPVTTYAVGETELLVVRAARLRELLDRNPVWYRDFARVICHKLRGALTHIEGGFLPASMRIATRLLDLARAYGRPGADGLALALPLPQDDLAHMLGLTRQSVNKELGVLERAGWIKRRRGAISLCDPAALRRHVLEGGGSDPGGVP